MKTRQSSLVALHISGIVHLHVLGLVGSISSGNVCSCMSVALSGSSSSTSVETQYAIRGTCAVDELTTKRKAAMILNLRQPR